MLSDDEIQLMEAIGASGSLTRAAASLGKAPSTVSYTLRQIETRFDALLFDRRRYRLQLTPAGALLVREATRLRDDMQRLTRRVTQVAKGWEDRLWIVTDELIAFESLMPVIQDFDALASGVSLRITHEVLGGTWEALAEGRADLVIGATNEPPTQAGVQWRELGVLSWVYAVSPRHPLAKVKGPLTAEQMQAHRAVVVADSSRRGDGRAYGHGAGQATLAVPSMTAKIAAQRAGLGVGWLPEVRVASLLKRGELVAKQASVPREPNTLYLGWRAGDGRALAWWLEKLGEPRLCARLVNGVDGYA
ncbi:LysR family transcriptional regulator [Pelomonas sp. Root1237]|uniref:LysR family transcriptional regulator n=1 Tax=Pelomonas sp. Root1237 TaxID=1736434 RepID=UPI0006F985D1|nr:LysR family transcriptional regulator [Pelomonas sp. Root1237]KQV94830.1 LysR family transcriptional regulator [Pelomonas sp. Root1237]